MPDFIPWDPTIDLVSSPVPGICYYPQRSYPLFAQDLPAGTQIFTTHDSRDPLRISIPVPGSKEQLVLIPNDVWGNLPPETAKEAFEESFGAASWRPTPASCGRWVVRRSLRGIPLRGRNGYAHDEDIVRRFAKEYFLGPAIQQQRSHLKSASMVDMKQAYLWALCQPLPYGLPHAWAQCGRTLPKMAAFVRCTIRDRYGLVGMQAETGYVYPPPSEPYEYKGTLYELRAGVLSGRIEQLTKATGWVFQSTDRGAVIGQWIRQMYHNKNTAAQAAVAKLLYTRGWATHYFPGYMRGIVSRSGQPHGFTECDGRSPYIFWQATGIDPNNETGLHNTMLQRPDRSAHVVAYVRVRMQEFCQRVLDAGGTIGQLLTDAIIFDSKATPTDLIWDGDGRMGDIEGRTGEWGYVDGEDGNPCIDVEYQGLSPGRYQLRRGRHVVRNKSSGRAHPVGWDSFSRMIREDQALEQEISIKPLAKKMQKA